MGIKLKTVVIILILNLWLMSSSAFGGLSITVLYDNSPYLEGVKEDWGFSCLISAGKRKILFDTGKEKTILFANAQKLEINLKSIDSIIISHLHLDHMGGLFPLLEVQPEAKVFLPELTTAIREMFIKYRPGNYILVERPIQIGKGLFLTGNMGKGVMEQALIINTPPGLIIVAGCSHPGIINIIRRSKELMKRPVYMVLGGFHSMPGTVEGLLGAVNEFKALGVRKVAPAHCTEEQIKMAFKAGYKRNYITVGAGRVLNFSRRKLDG